MRTYSELIKFPDFASRFNYLRLSGAVGESTFGFDRYLNQQFYHSDEWKQVRRQIILRDTDGSSVLDLGCNDRPIFGRIYIHHMNPLSIEDIQTKSIYLLDPEFLICCSKDTHDAIHYGDERILSRNIFVDRTPNDTCPWR